MTIQIKRRTYQETKLQSFPSALSPLLKRIYAARGVTSSQELDNNLQYLQQPHLKGLEQAVALLSDAVTRQRKVLIVGDFDADGATSCALAVLALRAMGLQQVDFLVPNRFDYGYGLTPEIVAVAAAMSPDIIVTVDNGISSVSGVQAAQAQGIKVLITDHHLPGEILPAADAIVNPNQPGCEFSSKNLAGVGVIFYVMSALRSALRAQNWFEKNAIAEPNMGHYLDLVALGTVADVVPLDHNNRILVQQGLLRMRAGLARPGILAMLAVAGRNHQRIAASDLGFTVGPRLNAAGRLDDMSLGIQCLLCDSPELAREMALELDDLNRDRKAIEGSMQQEALHSLASMSLNEEELPWGLCLYDATWHQGVIGILASRIKEKYHRPTIIFADSGEHDEIKGSARSIPGFHIRDALDAIAKRYPQLLNKFGGHAMAAGLSLRKEYLADFSRYFDEEVKRQLCEEDLQAVLLTDGELQPHEFSLSMAQSLNDAGPWGQHFPEPLFEGEFIIREQRLVGEKHLKLSLRTVQENLDLEAIAFNVDLKQWPNAQAARLKAAYRLSVNEYRNRETLQLMISAMEPCSN